MSDPMAVGTDAFLQSWYQMEVYAFPPFSLIRQVLNKLRTSINITMTLLIPSDIRRIGSRTCWSC